MYYQLLLRVEAAENHVVCHPNHREPSRPVAAAKHKRSTNNRHQAQEQDPDRVILKRIPSPELVEVVSKRNYAHSYKQPTDDGHREWTFVHMSS